jgi:hypothetical protein
MSSWKDVYPETTRPDDVRRARRDRALPVAGPVSALAQALFVAALFALGYFLLQRRDAGGK